jgi:hypothetical protein
MTRTPQDPAGPNENRTRIALAALTGFLAGVTRALTDWLLDHLGN